MTFTTLGRYQIRGEIGRGNMGVVYRAHDPVIDRPVALKTIVMAASTTDGEREAFLARFFQEARTAGRLLHPNIVVTYDAALDRETGIPFIAMELIEGETLAERLRREGRIPWHQAVDWAHSLAGALHQAHLSDIIHRDIKPANIMINRQGTPKITDFGIAKLPAGNLTETGIVVGTPYFMSPEQLRGEPLDGRSDVFSLGVLLYNLVTGIRPFEAADLAAIASQVLHKNARPVSEVVPEAPPALDGVLRRALMKAPEARYRTGEEFARDLASVKNGSNPSEAVLVADRTQAAGIPKTAAGRAPEPAEAVEEASPSAASAAFETVRRFGSELWKRVRSSSRRRTGALLAALLLLLLSAAFLFRSDLARWKLYLEASREAKNGELELSEQKLESILENDPEWERARNLVTEVSAQLVLPELPVELPAEHHHRLGSCKGRLTLREDGVEYGSKSHGLWRWDFAHVRELDAGGARRVALSTYEDDMLGLLDRKNYNFTLLGVAVDPEFWKRYERLFLRADR
jgi:serine/threonine-protein kinase